MSAQAVSTQSFEWAVQASNLLPLLVDRGQTGDLLGAIQQDEIEAPASLVPESSRKSLVARR